MIFIIIIIVLFIVPSIAMLVKTRLTLKISAGIVCAYISALIILSIVSLLLPKAPLVASAKAPQSNGTEICKNIIGGKFEAPSGFNKTTYSFVPSMDTLEIQFTGNNPNSSYVGSKGADVPPQVYYGTKGTDVPDNGDGKIDVYCYMLSSANVCGANFSAGIKGHSVLFDGGSLTVAAAAKQVRNFYKFDNGVSAFHLFGVTLHSNSSSFMNEQIYILLPRGIEAYGPGCVNLADLK